MRILVTWGSKRGGTEGIARIVGDELRREGHDVRLSPAARVRAVDADAVIVGGALYANRWHVDARRFVRRHRADLRRVPVWFFSSGPLDESADDGSIGPTTQVENLMRRIGALGHATFGGRLAPDARGFPARAMAKTKAGDWRNGAIIRAWTRAVAKALPTAQPGPIVAVPGGSRVRLVAHAFALWASCAVIMGLLVAAVPLGAALALHAVLAPIVSFAVARRYFRAAGAREPLATAFTFVAVVALLDVVAGLVEHGLAMFASVLGTWLPLALIFGAAWATGVLAQMAPMRRARPS
jgi:menaquinone-dependent protoporphyrinogen oxidase